jgi:hypothetical protein
MENTLNIFNTVEFLEPKCPGCNQIIRYDVNTKFIEKKQKHMCINCNEILD